MTIPSLYGKGLSWPLRLDASGAKFAMSSEEEKVREALESLLGTTIGEEPFLVKNGIPYGTRGLLVVFEPEHIARDIIVFDTKRAIRTWEPRVILDDVDVVSQQEPLGLAFFTTVSFRYRATNRPDNLVVPYRRPGDGKQT